MVRVKLYSIFWKRKSLRALYAYIFVLFAFAVGYNQMDIDNFYHTTAKYEQSNKDLLEAARDTLIHEFEYLGGVSPKVSNTRFKERELSNLERYHELVETNSELVGVLDFYSNRNSIYIQLHIAVTQKLKDLNNTRYLTDTEPFNFGFLGENPFYLTPTIKFDFIRHKNSSSGGHKYTLSSDSTTHYIHSGKNIPITIKEFYDRGFLQFNGLEIDYKELIFPKFGLTQYGEKFKIILSSKAYRFIGNVYNVDKGFPKNTSGSFIRMLYLSASAITTLGLGDIYPISSWARFWVIVESILGVVIIGIGVSYLFSEVT